MSSVASVQSNAPSQRLPPGGLQQSLGVAVAHALERVGIELLPDLGRVLHVLADVVGLVGG